MHCLCIFMGLAVFILSLINVAEGWTFRRSQVTEDFPPLLNIYGDGGSTTEFALGIAQAFDDASGIFFKLFGNIAFKKRIIGIDNPRHIEVIKYKMS